MSLLSFFGIKRTPSLDIGQRMPEVQAPAQDGFTYDLALRAGAGWTLVFFYPRADTPNCTKQACSLRDYQHEFEKFNIKVVGISADSEEAQKKFASKHELTFPLLADKDHRISRAFGVPRLGQLLKRQAYLFYNGELVWRDLSASTTSQAIEVLDVVRKIEKQRE